MSSTMHVVSLLVCNSASQPIFQTVVLEIFFVADAFFGLMGGDVFTGVPTRVVSSMNTELSAEFPSYSPIEALPFEAYCKGGL